MPFETGPYIQVATFCENVIEDKTGALSLIRLIDTLTHSVVGPDPPKDMPPITYRMKLVIALKSAEARGRHDIRIVPQMPSGETKSPMEGATYFEGEERGHSSVVDVSFTFEMEGLYWFVVYLDEALLTKIPFRVKYEYHRAVAGPAR